MEYVTSAPALDWFYAISMTEHKGHQRIHY